MILNVNVCLRRFGLCVGQQIITFWRRMLDDAIVIDSMTTDRRRGIHTSLCIWLTVFGITLKQNRL